MEVNKMSFLVLLLSRKVFFLSICINALWTNYTPGASMFLFSSHDD